MEIERRRIELGVPSKLEPIYSDDFTTGLLYEIGFFEKLPKNEKRKLLRQNQKGQQLVDLNHLETFDKEGIMNKLKFY